MKVDYTDMSHVADEDGVYRTTIIVQVTGIGRRDAADIAEQVENLAKYEVRRLENAGVFEE